MGNVQLFLRVPFNCFPQWHFNPKFDRNNNNRAQNWSFWLLVTITLQMRMLRTDKPYHIAWLWGLESRKGYRRIRAVVTLNWHCRQYKGTRAPEYCSTRWALAVQGYQSTRVLQYWIGTASTRVPEQQSTAVLDGHWQYTSTHFLRHIYHAIYWLISSEVRFVTAVTVKILPAV